MGKRIGRMVLGVALLVAALAGPALAANLDDVWRYEGTITSQGTRSEGFAGALFSNGQAVPARIGQIRTPIGDYRFEPAGMPWKPSGWLRTKGLVEPGKSEQAFEAGVHWYKGGKRPGMPGDWLWLPGQQAWVAAEFLKEFAETELKSVAEPESGLAALAEEMTAKQPKVEAHSAVFAYEQGVFGAGSKSAGERGALFYNGKAIPVRMGSLKTPIGSYRFVAGAMLWEAQGWFQAEEIAVGDTSVPFSKADAVKGSYAGARKAGTPADWCYEPETKSWFAPEKLL